MMQQSGERPVPPELRIRTFAIVVLATFGVLAATFWSDLGRPEQRSSAIGVAFCFGAILAFLGVRWQHLQHRVSNGDLSVEDLRASYQQHLLGPIRQRIALVAAIVVAELIWAAINTQWK